MNLVTHGTSNDDVAARDDRYRRYLDFDTLFPAGPFDAHWIGDETLWFVVDEPGGPTFSILDLAADTVLITLTLARIASALPPIGLPTGSLPFERVELDREAVRFIRGRDGARLDRRDGVLAPLLLETLDAGPFGRFTRRLLLSPPTPVPNVVAPNGLHYATVVDGNVLVVDAKNGRTTALTGDAGGDIGWDLESGRRAFARTKPSTVSPWSPDSRLLVASRVDRSRVRTIPTFDFLHDDIAVGSMHAEAPGTPYAQVDPVLFDFESGARIAIDLGDTSKSLVVFAGWMPDGGDAWFIRFTRDLKRADVIAVDRSGTTRVVLVEEAGGFVRVQHDVLYPGNVGLTLLPDSSGFLWMSERSGWNHIHRVDRDGTRVEALTSGAWPVLAVEAVDPACITVFFTAHPDAWRPYDVHLCRSALAGGPMQRLTEGSGQRRISVSPSRRFFVETRSTPADPPVTTARDADGRVVRVLHTTDIATLRAIGWRPPEEVVVKANDGTTDLWGVLYLPADFDPAHRYPIVEHVYGGPQVAYVERGFWLGASYKPWNHPQALAQLGFAVIVLDAPGTPERSKAFHDDVLRGWGERQVSEHAAALRRIAATRPYLDLTRVGVFGHSWGGFLAFRALVDAPDLYSCGVVSGPGLTPNNLMSEPYLGADRDAESYRHYDALPLAPKLVGHVLLVAGTSEVPMFHDVLRMSHALIEAGIRHEVIVLPGQSHGYAGRAADYFIDATTRFFQRHLGDDLNGPRD